MMPSDYTVQEHIAELQRVAQQMRLARELRAQEAGSKPNIVARWLNRLFAALRRQERHPQPERMPAPRTAFRRPAQRELCIEDAVG